MENKETKSSMKGIKNKIILKNLSDKQKEVLRKTGIIGGGVGLGTGLLTLYSMKAPEIIPGLSIDTTTTINSNDLTENEHNNTVELVSFKPVAEINDQNISFGEAFKFAREICGPGGWFIWKGNIYNTFYKEEWQNLSKAERNDYFASIEITNIKGQENQNITNVQTHESYKENIASSEDIKDDNEPVSNIQEKEFSIDINAYKDQAANIDHQNLSVDSSVVSNDLVTGEIITLDDDTDIIDNGYFELPDDIEITAISDEESYLIDKLTFDSSEVTAFPWETTELVADNEILENEVDAMSAELIEDSKEHITDKARGSNEEYPWGEKISNTIENKAETQVLEEIQQDDTSNIISNPEEITEYPWGEKIEVNEMASNAQIIIHENDVINLKEENVGVILPEETETNSLSQLPPSFNDITEFPWGETVPHSPVNPYTSPENDFFENPTIQHPTLLDDNE
jgi:hypothetical protein